METPLKLLDKQKLGKWWADFLALTERLTFLKTEHRVFFTKKGMISLIGVFVLFIAGIALAQHPWLNTESVPAIAAQPVQTNETGRVQELEKQARSMDKLANKPSLWPVVGEVTSVFGWRNSPWGGGSEFHPGIDIANSMGTPIVATADGEVVQSEAAGGYGNIVKINHGNGIETIYGHNSSLAVSAGQSVKKGQIIAYLGSTGRSTGPHLHYEIRANGTAVDPISFLVSY